MQDKRKQMIQMIIGCSLFMIAAVLIIYKCYEVDRLIYINDWHYEHKTLGDIGKQLFEKFMRWFLFD